MEEIDLSKSSTARNRLKEWVTAKSLSIRKMRTDVFHQPNTLHFIQCTNQASSCPVWPYDSRIVMCHVPSPAQPIPKQQLLRLLESEASQFLATIMQLTMPEPDGRLRVAVLETSDKLALGHANAPAAKFIDECCRLNPTAKIAKSDLHGKYEVWCTENGHTVLTPSEFGKQLLEFTEHKVTPRGKVENQAGRRVDAYTGIELCTAA